MAGGATVPSPKGRFLPGKQPRMFLMPCGWYAKEQDKDLCKQRGRPTAHWFALLSSGRPLAIPGAEAAIATNNSCYGINAYSHRSGQFYKEEISVRLGVDKRNMCAETPSDEEMLSGVPDLCLV